VKKREMKKGKNRSKRNDNGEKIEEKEKKLN
jgi:hypothetical protein